MPGMARSGFQAPRLGSEDPFRPDLYARVQNARVSRIGSLGSSVWRGHGSWSTGAAHQRVTVKIRYRNDAKGAVAYAKYMVKDGKGLDGQAPEAWDNKHRNIDAPGRVREWMKEGDERWFKIVFSPEKPFRDVEGMVTHAMNQAEEHLGTRLDWFTARHYDGAKDHVHVFLRGRDEQGNPLSIDKRYIQFGFRDSAQRYVTYHPKFGLGERSVQEIDKGRERAAQIREQRAEVRSLVLAARAEGVLDRKREQRLLSDSYNAAPTYLEEIKGEMRGLLDQAENVWRERSGPEPVVDRDHPRVPERTQERVSVNREFVSRQIERAELQGKIDALDADRFRQSLNRSAPDDVHRAVEDAVKAKAGAGRDAGQSQDAERIKRRGGLSL